MQRATSALVVLALCLAPSVSEARAIRPITPPPPTAGSGPPPFCSVCSSVGFNTTNLLYTGTSGQGATNIYDVEVGDFNNDGNPDWVAATPNGSTFPGRLWVHLGDGSGNFTAPSTWFDVGSNPAAIAAGDLDGDQNLDLVVAGSASNVVSVLLGNGNGTFQPEVRYGTGGSNPRTLTLADMDDDGDLDVVVGNRNSDNIAILDGDGAGNLGTANVVISALPTPPKHVVTDDFDNDGRRDIAVVIFGPVSIYLQDSTGGFVISWAYLPDSDTNHAAATDLDRDGNTDLVSADGFSTVSVATGLGTGIFNAPVPFSAPWAYPDDVAVADFDGDCDLDVAAAHSNSTPMFRLSVLLGDGLGGLGSATPYDLGPLSNLTTAIRTADFNQDGRPDVIVANLYNYASVAINNCPCNPPPGSPGRLVITDAEFPLSVNGIYTLSTPLNGKPRYVSGDNTLWWTNANYWNLHDDNEQRFTHSDNTPFPPATGWLKMPQNSASEMHVLACP